MTIPDAAFKWATGVLLLVLVLWGAYDVVAPKLARGENADAYISLCTRAKVCPSADDLVRMLNPVPPPIKAPPPPAPAVVPAPEKK